MDILLELGNPLRKSPVTTVTESAVLGNLIFFTKQEPLTQEHVEEQVGSRGRRGSGSLPGTGPQVCCLVLLCYLCIVVVVFLCIIVVGELPYCLCIVFILPLFFLQL